MNKIKIILSTLGILFGVLFLFKYYIGTDTPIGGSRDAEGCLISAGYSFDSGVGACIRAFEFTSDIKWAAQMAVDKVGKGYALTVVSFNSYEEAGSYDIFLERGPEREAVTVYIRRWAITPEQ